MSLSRSPALNTTGQILDSEAVATRIGRLGLDRYIEFKLPYSNSPTERIALREVAGAAETELAALGQELAIITKRPVTLSLLSGKIRLFSPSAAQVIFPEWIVNDYSSTPLGISDCQALLAPLSLGEDEVAERRMLVPRLSQQIREILRGTRLPGGVEDLGSTLQVTLDISRVELGEHSFQEFLRNVNSLGDSVRMLRILIHPSLNRTLRDIGEEIAEATDPVLSSFNDELRTAELPLPDHLAVHRYSTQLTRDYGWSVTKAPGITLPPGHSHLITIHSDHLNKDFLRPANKEDVDQIRWAMPNWIPHDRVRALGQYVLVCCRLVPPSEYIPILVNRLRQTNVPVILTTQNGAAQPNWKFSRAELDDIVSSLLPSNAHLRHFELGAGNQLLIKVYSQSKSGPSLSELEQRLRSFLVGSTLYFDPAAPCQISEVHLQIESLSERFSAMLRKAGPILRKFATNVASNEGHVRLPTELPSQSKVAEAIHKAVADANLPLANTRLKLPFNAPGAPAQGVSPIIERAAWAIDPVGTRLCEDAISAEPLAEGGYRVKVHIARVSYYVRPGSDLDQYALKRLLAIYPPDGGHTLFMLPKELLLDKVGFKRGTARPAWTISIQLSRDGKIVSGSISPRLIQIDNYLTTESTATTIESSACPNTLAMIDRAAELFSAKHKELRGEERARSLVETHLQMTENVIAPFISSFGLPILRPRISGAARDYERLVMQYLLEVCHGNFRPPSSAFLGRLTETIQFNESIGLRRTRERGATLMKHLDELHLSFNEKRRGSLYSTLPDGSISVTVQEPFIRDRLCILDPATFVPSSDGTGVVLQPSRRQIRFFEYIEFRITGIDLVTGKLLVAPVE